MDKSFLKIARFVRRKIQSESRRVSLMSGQRVRWAQVALKALSYKSLKNSILILQNRDLYAEL